ncbi:putative glutamine-dependent NAD(+) synthetase [Chlamydiales bacterium STE3]|nr:putative glutamine-dependent NAD(+) synthetase [Chlamydiales bacterium STE3]
MRILAAQINPLIADIKGNTQKIIESIQRAKEEQCAIVVFPELALTGYPPEDFLLLPHFIEAAEKALPEIAKETAGITAIIGTIRKSDPPREKPLFNTAAIISETKILGFQDKTLLPTYDIFDERRYFEPARDNKIWHIAGKKVAITICEDLWQHSSALKDEIYFKDPILNFENKTVDLLLNLSASPFHMGKFPNRLQACTRAAKTLRCPVILSNQVGGNDSLIFDGRSLFVNGKGELMAIGKSFEEDALLIDLGATRPSIAYFFEEMEELYQALVLGVKDYFNKSGFKKACLGLSGGIDSALVACIATDALGAENVLAILMPSRYSSKGSVEDAPLLAHRLGIHTRYIPIEEPFKSYLQLLEPHFEERQPDTTEENLQARIRGMILMAISNKLGHIVLNTGNKSELAMGYATLYGDLCGGLAVISDVTKSQVYALSRWINKDQEIIPKNSIEKPPSAELRPQQKDSDSLPEYALIDRILKEYLENSLPPEVIAHKDNIPLEIVESLVARIHHNEYKRRQSPPGLRVSEKAFFTGRRFPIVQGWI